MKPIRYSRGTDRFDNKPTQHEADNFDEFEEIFLSDRADAKFKTFVCAAFAEGEHSKPEEYPGIRAWRQKDLVMPRAFLPFDFDGFNSPETFKAVRAWLGRFRGFAYTTASHTPEVPRCRVVLAQSRETDREEGKALCVAVQAMLEREIGAGRVTFDASVYKAEQPLFTPLYGAETFRFDGKPVDVDAVLATAPPAEDWSVRQAPTVSERAATIAHDDPVLASLDLLGMVKRELGAGKYAVQCPCSETHTSESGETSTVYYLPNFAGVKYGKFHCLHEHCRERPQEQYLEAMGLDPHDVWRAQRGESVAAADDDTRVKELAALSPIEYDRIREAEAERMGVRVSTLDKMVKGAFADAVAEGEPETPLPTVEPWPYAVEGAPLLDEIAVAIRRFIVCDVETGHAAALWCALTWLIESVDVAPLAVITAPEKRCGKTQLLSLMGKLVRRPMSASNISPAALFRSIDAWSPTLMVDEADAFMRDNEELRGILNSGHARDTAYVVRVVGDDHQPTQFSTWGCKAIAGIGHLADTLMDRAIVLPLRRKLPHEKAERLRHVEPDLFEVLAQKLARFAKDNSAAVRAARPILPAALNDRAQDNWEPLLAIAEAAGGDWPELARRAALKLSNVEEDATVGDELLADIQAIFTEPKIATSELLIALCQDDEKSWATFNRGRPLSARQLANKLKGYGIKSKNVRVENCVVKGFELTQFEDAFARYLSPPVTPFLSATTLHTSIHAGLGVADSIFEGVLKNVSATPKPLQTQGCSAVADRTGEVGEEDKEEANDLV